MYITMSNVDSIPVNKGAISEGVSGYNGFLQPLGGSVVSSGQPFQQTATVQNGQSIPPGFYQQYCSIPNAYGIPNTVPYGAPWGMVPPYPPYPYPVTCMPY